MTLLLLLIAVVLWTLLLFAIGYVLTFPIKKRPVRMLCGIAVVLVAFTLPIRDELKGREEFEALCKAGGAYQISPTAIGKKFDLLFSATPYRPLAGYTRPVEEKTISFSDAATGDVLATAKSYRARGGWLVQRRIIALTSTDGPLIGRDECSPSDSEEARRQQITNKIVN